MLAEDKPPGGQVVHSLHISLLCVPDPIMSFDHSPRKFSEVRTKEVPLGSHDSVFSLASHVIFSSDR